MNAMGNCGDPMDERPHTFEGNICTRCGHQVVPLGKGAIDRWLGFDADGRRLEPIPYQGPSNEVIELLAMAQRGADAMRKITGISAGMLGGDVAAARASVDPETGDLKYEAVSHADFYGNADEPGLEGFRCDPEPLSIPTSTFWAGPDGVYAFQDGRAVKVSEAPQTVEWSEPGDATEWRPYSAQVQARGVKFPAGWDICNHETILRRDDGKCIPAAGDPANWLRQIEDFEFVDGTQWAAAQIAAMKVSDTRSCTCHPDEATAPCAEKYAASECAGAAGTPRLDESAQRLKEYWVSEMYEAGYRYQNQIATVTESRLPLLSGDGMSGDDPIVPEDCEIEFDRTAMQSKVAVELRPPPEHADKPLHWVCDSDGMVTVLRWETIDGKWLDHGWETELPPDDQEFIGCRYLGPAEFNASAWEREQRLRAASDEVLGVCATRIAELEENARWNTQQFDAFQDDNQAKFARICELENEIALTKATPIHTDDPQATDPIGPNDEAHRSVEETIGHIVNGRVIPSARAKVRAALDKADAPPTGRAASDAALGRALR